MRLGLGMQSTEQKLFAAQEQTDGGFLCHQRPTGQTSLSATWALECLEVGVQNRC